MIQSATTPSDFVIKLGWKTPQLKLLLRWLFAAEDARAMVFRETIHTKKNKTKGVCSSNRCSRRSSSSPSISCSNRCSSSSSTSSTCSSSSSCSGSSRRIATLPPMLHGIDCRYFMVFPYPWFPINSNPHQWWNHRSPRHLTSSLSSWHGLQLPTQNKWHGNWWKKSG